MFLRPIRSEVEDQPMRPAMLAADSRATKPAAAEADTGVEVSAKKSVIIGAAFSRMPIPAVTFMQSTTHRHQNCGVRTASRAETCGPDGAAGPAWAVLSAAVLSPAVLPSDGLSPDRSSPDRSSPDGFPGRGTRTSSTP